MRFLLILFFGGVMALTSCSSKKGPVLSGEAERLAEPKVLKDYRLNGKHDKLEEIKQRQAALEAAEEIESEKDESDSADASKASPPKD